MSEYKAVQWGAVISYNVVSFLKIPYNRHPIARPWGRDMGCVLLIQISIYVMPQKLEYCMQYHVVLAHII